MPIIKIAFESFDLLFKQLLPVIAILITGALIFNLDKIERFFNMPTKSTPAVEFSQPFKLSNYTRYIILFFVLMFGLMSIYIIPAGTVGIITRWGAVNRIAQPGIGFKFPIGEGVTKMDIRTQKDQADAAAASKDLQLVTSTIAVNYHLDGKYASDIYKTVGTNYVDILIAPAIQNIFKATTAQFTAKELITNREAVRVKAEAALAEQLNKYHIIVENFNIVNFYFSPEFSAAIEAKQVAQQQVETAKQKLAQAQVDAQTVITAAKGQADAQAAVKNTGALTPEYLQYLALTKWDGHLPTVTGGAAPFIDVSQFQSPNSTPVTENK